MSEGLPERMKELEDELAKIECSVEGVAEQAMDATAQLTGLLVRFLQEAGLVDQVALRTFLTRFAARAPESEDHVGALVARVIGILDFQELYPEDYS